MMKWLRAHTKKIMVAVVLLAMLAFLGSDAMIAMLSPSDRTVVVAHAFGQPITNIDLFPAQRETHALDNVMLSWRYDADGKMTVEHWFALQKEAERAGMVVSDQEVEEEIQRQQQFFQQMNNVQNLFDWLRTTRDITPPQLRQAVRSHLMIRKYAENVHMASVPSEPEVRHFVRDTEEKVQARYAMLDAQKFFDAAEPVTDVELAEQFEANRDYVAADSPSGFGYKYPRRVRLQYVVANLATIQSQITPSLEELTAYWKANRAKYQKVTYELPTPAVVPVETQPAGSPPEEPVRKLVEKTFSEARPDVERDVKQRTAQQSSEQAMRKVASLLARPWQGLPTDAQTGYKPIPSGVDAPDFMKTIVEQASREMGVGLEYVETELLTREDIAANRDLRNMLIAGEGPNGLAISEYAFRVPAFHRHEPGAETTLSLQLFQAPDAPLTASEWSIQFAMRRDLPVARYGLFRVVEARESQSPAGLDEVRVAVEHDVQMRKAFERMKPVAEQLYAASLRLGLKPAAELFKEHLTMQLDEPTIAVAPFARLMRIPQAQMMDALRHGKPTTMPFDVPGIGSEPAFINAAFDMTQEGWRPAPPAAADGPELAAATTRPAVIPEPKVTRVEIPRQRRIYVLELVEHQPVHETRYETELRQTGYFTLLASRAAALRVKWFDPKQIEARCSLRRETEEPVPPSTEGINPPAKAGM